MRLIDADALPIKFDGHTVSVWKADLEAAPTIDAVPVVRCKDCKYARPTIDRSWMCSEATGREWVDEDHFCSYGERRMDD